MPIYLSDADVRRLLTPDECAAIIEKLCLDDAGGMAEQTPTTELHLPRGPFRVKVGGAYGFNSYGLKAYLGNAGYRVFVWDLEEGFAGVVEAFELTELRTGAVSAVAAKHLARPDAQTLGIIGTGREARSQLDAVSRVRKLKQVRAFSRNEENRATYAKEMSERLGLNVEPVDSAEACVRDADIVLTITSANEPVLKGEWIADGAFVCGVGATGVYRRELDEQTVARAELVVVESLPVAEAECGDLIFAVSRGRLRWNQVVELKDVVSGRVPARSSPHAITLFDSIGTGAQDVAIAAEVIRKARAGGIGVELPIPPPTVRRR
jgi:ornithine cyclodeaminase/alanine dehydrogenase-like protein (mu-crystallin family)